MLAQQMNFRPSYPFSLIGNVSGVHIFVSSPTPIAADTDDKARCIARMLCLVAFCGHRSDTFVGPMETSK